MAEEKVKGYCPGVPFAWLEWDDTYEYYVSYAPALKITATDLHGSLREVTRGEIGSKKWYYIEGSILFAENTWFDRVFYNPSLGGFQPAFDINYSNIIDRNSTVFPPVNNLELVDSEGNKYKVEVFQTRELTDDFKIVQLDVTREELLGYGKSLPSIGMGEEPRLGIYFSYKLYYPPPELDLKKKIEESLKEKKITKDATSILLKYPAVLLFFEVNFEEQKQYWSDGYTIGPFVISFNPGGAFTLYDFSLNKIENEMERDKNLENLLKKHLVFWGKGFSPFVICDEFFTGGSELFELGIADRYFQVGSGTCEKEGFGGKDFNSVIIQAIDGYILIQSPKTKNIIDLKGGVKYPILRDDVRKRLKSFRIYPDFVAIRGACALLEAGDLTYLDGEIRRYDIPNDTIKKSGVNVLPKIIYEKSDYIGDCEMMFDTYPGLSSNSPIKFIVKLKHNNTLIPIFRSVFADYDRLAIKPKRPSWWEDGFRLYPTSISGSERFDGTEFTLGFYFPPETTDPYLTKLRKILQNMRGVYPVKLYMGYMLIGEEKVVETPGGLEVQKGGEFKGYLEEDGIKDYECIKGFVYSGVSRKRGNIKGELSLSFTDRSLMLKEQFVVGLPFYDGWGVNAAVDDLLFRAGFIKEKQYPNSKIYPIDVALGSQLSLGTQKGPTYDIKMGTSFWDAIKRIIEVFGWWFFVLRDGGYCLTHPRRLFELTAHLLRVKPVEILLTPPDLLVPEVYGYVGSENFYMIPFHEKSSNWKSVILGPLNYNEDYKGSYNQYMIMGFTPAYTRNYEVNPFAIPIIKKNPETLDDMKEKIEDPDSDKNKGFTYFPYMKNAFKAEADLNYERVVSVKLRQESKRLFKPHSTVEFTTFGRSIYKPLDIAIVIESDEPKVLPEEEYSGGNRGIGWFLITEVSHNMDMTRKHWEVTIKGERFYTDPDFFPYPKDFGY